MHTILTFIIAMLITAQAFVISGGHGSGGLGMNPHNNPSALSGLAGGVAGGVAGGLTTLGGFRGFSGGGYGNPPNHGYRNPLGGMLGTQGPGMHNGGGMPMMSGYRG